MHETEDTGGAGPVGSHQAVDQDRLTASQAVLYKLEERTNKQGKLLQAVSCVLPPESHVEGEVTEIQTSQQRGKMVGSQICIKGRVHLISLSYYFGPFSGVFFSVFRACKGFFFTR